MKACLCKDNTFGQTIPLLWRGGRRSLTGWFLRNHHVCINRTATRHPIMVSINEMDEWIICSRTTRSGGYTSPTTQSAALFYPYKLNQRSYFSTAQSYYLSRVLYFHELCVGIAQGGVIIRSFACAFLYNCQGISSIARVFSTKASCLHFIAACCFTK